MGSLTFARSQSPLRSMPQLDGLRAVAILMVFVHHWIPGRYQGGLPWGDMGVDLFFVLSGYLITSILLQCRGYLEAGQGLFLTLRQFYARRALRILPLYYAALVGYSLVAQDAINTLTPWLWTYTVNWYRVLVDPQWGGPVSHFWSLAVEEQFYLIWPWVILTAPRRILPVALVAATLLGPLSRTAMALADVPERAIMFFTLARFDTLGLGAVLAYWSAAHGAPAVARSRYAAGLLAVGLVMSTAGWWLGGASWESTAAMLLTTTGTACVWGWTVIRAAAGFDGFAGRLLSTRTALYLGGLSYGLYVLHKPIPFLLAKVGVPVEALAPLPAFVLYTALSVVAAALSWRLFEGPINRLKERFPYDTGMRVARPTMAAAAGTGGG